jgi:hypothetical protein
MHSWQTDVAYKLALATEISVVFLAWNASAYASGGRVVLGFHDHRVETSEAPYSYEKSVTCRKLYSSGFYR